MVKNSFKYYKLTFFSTPTLEVGGEGYFTSKKRALDMFENNSPERGYNYGAILYTYTESGRTVHSMKPFNTLMWQKD